MDCSCWLGSLQVGYPRTPQGHRDATNGSEWRLYLTGNVWIFRIHRDHQERASNQQNFCAPVLYQYAFWSTLAVYIIALAAIVITFIVALIACGYIGTKLTDTSKKSESTQVDASV